MPLEAVKLPDTPELDIGLSVGKLFVGESLTLSVEARPEAVKVLELPEVSVPGLVVVSGKWKPLVP